MKILEQVVSMSLGVLISTENFFLVMAAIRNKTLRENTHYNLVISLSVCDFVVGLDLILYGSVIATFSDTNEPSVDIICEIHFQISAVIYLMSLFQAFSICLNRYFVITDNNLRHTIWNGNRKYLAFCVLLAISMVFNVPVLYTTLHGCDIRSVLGYKTTMYTFVLGSLQTIFLVLTFVIYFITLWKIYKMHKKTDVLRSSSEHQDEHKHHIRRRKRMLKSMKVVSLILGTLLVSVAPVVVLSFMRMSSLKVFLLVALSSSFNSAINPIIYCTQIKELWKEVKALLRIDV